MKLDPVTDEMVPDEDPVAAEPRNERSRSTGWGETRAEHECPVCPYRGETEGILRRHLHRSHRKTELIEACLMRDVRQDSAERSRDR